MATERDIHTIRNADGRGTSRVLVVAWSAAGKLATCVRVDGLGTGARFVVERRRFVDIKEEEIR